MKDKLTPIEMAKLQELADCALTASTKKEADKYIDQMQFLVNDVMGYSANVLAEMISAIKNTVGAVADKESKEAIARQLIIKADIQCVNR